MSAHAQSIVNSSEAKMSMEVRSPNSILEEFFSQREPAFSRLVVIREKGWQNSRGDDYFRKQRHRADSAKGKRALEFYKIMQKIGDEMQDRTHALFPLSNSPGDMSVLDICMAPGGYTASALKYNPGATAFGISLPPNQGGHEVLLPSSMSTIVFLDITMLAREFGVDSPPSTHPACASFLNERPFFGRTFQLIFCDGQVLRNHERPEYREHYEARRLTVSQLILALQRIRAGGTVIVLLHKIEAWDTLEILYRFSRFSSIQVFKPKTHAIRSSFYLVARTVQPHSEAAKLAVEAWKEAWWHATFGGEDGTGGPGVMINEEYIRLVLDQFGNEFVELARPIWEIQASALSKWKP